MGVPRHVLLFLNTWRARVERVGSGTLCWFRHSVPIWPAKYGPVPPVPPCVFLGEPLQGPWLLVVPSVPPVPPPNKWNHSNKGKKAPELRQSRKGSHATYTFVSFQGAEGTRSCLALDAHHVGARAKRVYRIGPRLHHVPALLQVGGVVVGVADFVGVTMGKLAFDPVPVIAAAI